MGKSFSSRGDSVLWTQSSSESLPSDNVMHFVRLK